MKSKWVAALIVLNCADVDRQSSCANDTMWVGPDNCAKSSHSTYACSGLKYDCLAHLDDNAFVVGVLVCVNVRAWFCLIYRIDFQGGGWTCCLD